MPSPGRKQMMMKQQRRRSAFPRAVLAILAGSLLLNACGGKADKAGEAPAVVEQVRGTNVNRVTLTPQAAKRLDIQTAPVRSDGKRAERRVIPYSAVLYDANGDTWTYTNPRPLAFVRQDISVDRIEGNSAVLTAGPPVGTAVVIVGADEIWGVEYGGIEED
jgi:hypothetical protein